MIPKDDKQFNRILMIAGVLNIVGLLLVLFSHFKVTPITIILSTAVGGGFIGLAVFLYLYVVIQDLRKRKLL